MQILVIAIAALIVSLAVNIGLYNPANYDTAAVVDSPAPEASYYGGAANMTAAVNTAMERYRLTNLEQSLVEICRATYYMGKSNNCSPLNESFTWAFLLQNGNTGNLNTVQALTSSSSFTCAHPGQYGVYLLNDIYSATDLAGYTYNLNNSAGTGAISGQTDPCAYSDIIL